MLAVCSATVPGSRLEASVSPEAVPMTRFLDAADISALPLSFSLPISLIRRRLSS